MDLAGLLHASELTEIQAKARNDVERALPQLQQRLRGENLHVHLYTLQGIPKLDIYATQPEQARKAVHDVFPNQGYVHVDSYSADKGGGRERFSTQNDARNRTDLLDIQVNQKPRQSLNGHIEPNPYTADIKDALRNLNPFNSYDAINVRSHRIDRHKQNL